MRRVLVIAGSDSSGGAGLEADQKVIAAHGCYAMTATTALTAQNTQGVRAIHETPPQFVQQMIDACIEDIGVDVVKTGMLASAATATVVAESLKRHGVLNTVVDPVMVSTSGSQLFPEDAVNTLCRELIPLATVLTPNVPEAQLLLRKNGTSPAHLATLDDLKSLAAAVHGLGCKYVLLKGGHLPLTSSDNVAQFELEKYAVANVLYDGSTFEIIREPYQESKNTHGTGCSLASAIACNISQGMSVYEAASLGCRYISAGIRTSPSLGKGAGPLNHFHSLQRLPFFPGTFIDYVLHRPDVRDVWQRFTHHDFTNKLGDGTLPPENFKNYMIQDYLYLIQYARANALAGYKSRSLEDIAGAAQIVIHIRHEINLHIAECAEFGLSQQEMEAHEESQACTAYTRYVLDIGQSEDWLALQVALMPCLLGYGMIARRLSQQQTAQQLTKPNRYLRWINNYVAEDYVAAVNKGCELIEKHAMEQSPKRIEDLVKIFIHATKMESGFWDMASSSVEASSSL